MEIHYIYYFFIGHEHKSWTFGKPCCVYDFCGAILWYEEKNQKTKQISIPKFSLCCMDGKVQLPLLKHDPEFLKKLMDYHGGKVSKIFREGIRGYNCMFSFTSM